MKKIISSVPNLELIGPNINSYSVFFPRFVLRQLYASRVHILPHDCHCVKLSPQRKSWKKGALMYQEIVHRNPW